MWAPEYENMVDADIDVSFAAWCGHARACDARIRAAVEAFSAELTPAHSITSRRPSLRALVRRHLDKPVSAALRLFGSHGLRDHLAGLRPSTLWSVGPRRDDRQTRCENIAAEAHGTGLAWRARIRKAIHQADREFSAHYQWSARFLQPVKPEWRVRLLAQRDQAAEQLEFLCATLDLLIYLIDYCALLQPKSSRQVGGKGERSHLLTRPRKHCDLCWRWTQGYAFDRDRAATPNGVQPSNRFCSEHDQRLQKSNYRRDLAYKEAFDDELNLYRKRSRAAGGFGLVRPASLDEEDLRRAAFVVVRLKLTKDLQQMAAWSAVGLPQADIARRLGVTRQAVSKALKTFHARLQRAEYVRWGSRNFPLQPG
jgi:DNA-binding CsgD family transcriptional regulator